MLLEYDGLENAPHYFEVQVIEINSKHFNVELLAKNGAELAEPLREDFSCCGGVNNTYVVT